MVKSADPEIRQFILDSVEEHPSDIVPLIVKQFGVTRQTAANYLARLIREGVLVGKGVTSARRYELKQLDYLSDISPITPTSVDDEFWRTRIAPRMEGVVPDNVRRICEYGFTEMFNNVIDHSESPTCLCIYERNAQKVRLSIIDDGVGIFDKIMKAFDLSDKRQALLELAKGKLTTDAKRHSGEGIFFTSRAADIFFLMSGELSYSKRRSNDGWLFETEPSKTKIGTGVTMVVYLSSKHTLKETFDKFSSGDEYGFSKTHVPLRLAKHEGENLVSRSQAKRLLARVDNFTEVLLDFEGIDSIGQAFADEIFRVYAQSHPNIEL